ncbi:hypothetical protein SGQ44_06200 [Flavobacterium sp. Fl-77]|uniref:Uncharacterized protein n=1 Tax=Flavobacterium flavipigmentatum TaxID=2893884 RepID=A0AAJ2VXJ1_9FLAO|nr:MULTISPECIES: hypothetical protein [unclassified Flavobacterium]MDX6181626.1 hypothetical protein [Flavobacterium sp. Fl-33]MDX6185340.1 hypothetical protein [Flavobacterium sp. Fl-77]UFH37445.1 hypothetical protein LNP22_11930 [Flavobacterium sp. F-70]
MKWIRKTIIFVSLLFAALFAFQADQTAMDKRDSEKKENTFSVHNSDALAFIQPQASFQLVASAKTSYPVVLKWFEALLIEIPDYQSILFANNFANQCFNQSKKLSILLYPFHFFW